MKTKLILGALMFAALLSAQTQVPSTMLKYPPVQFTAIQVLTPGGIMLVQLDSSIVIDTSGPVPVLKAVVPVPVAQKLEQTDVFTVTGQTQPTFSLRAVPLAGSIIKVHRNGLRMATGVDYTLAGKIVTFIGTQTPVAGDIVLVDLIPE